MPDVLADVAAERARQEEKFPEQHLPFGTDGRLIYRAEAVKLKVDKLAESGKLTWMDVLFEEFSEAEAEEDLGRLREELVQVAAVAVRIIEDIDRERMK